MRTTRDKSSKYSAAIPMRFKSSRLGCLSLAFIMAISACSKLGVESSEIEDLESGVRITGAVEKGPFILGSSVEISAADNNGISTGQVYQTHTKNDLGEFEIQINHRGPISIKGEGFYFNELLGELSWANMTLFAFSRVLNNRSQAVNINLITHLTYNRIKKLIQNGAGFRNAVSQAERELIEALSIGPDGFNPNASGSRMNILGGNNVKNAYLFAVSAVLTHAAAIEADIYTDGVLNEDKAMDAELQELINSISLDIEDDGQIGAILAAKISQAESSLDANMVMDNLANRIGDLGSDAEVPDLHLVLDQDGDNIVNSEDNCPLPVTEEICDLVDNDCDGQVDEGCSCNNGDVRECGTSAGACEAGIQRCVGGDWGRCEGNVGPEAESCGDGVDNNCNGLVDENCCEPDCSNRVCGDDGCNGSCGECGSDSACADGICVISNAEDSLSRGENLLPGQIRRSNDGRFELIYQPDGNLVLYRLSTGEALWASDTWGTSAGRTAMQGDGNLVVYDAEGTAQWATDTDGSDAQLLVVQDDGNLVLYDSSRNALWASNTMQSLSNDCMTCTGGLGCDAACQNAGFGSSGTCAFPGSTDSSQCCTCSDDSEPLPSPQPDNGDDGYGYTCGNNQCELTSEMDDFLSERVGFGRNATGGLGGNLCMVTNLNNSGYGSLRGCLLQAGPTWIRFQVSGDITLNSDIDVPSNTTVDGRGKYIRIFGGGLYLNGVNNVIINNIIFKQGNGNDDNDAIRVKNNTQNVWIHHVSLSDYGDGLIDITRGSTDVTVSWCKFSIHRKTMLISASHEHVADARIRVTLHHNWFKTTSSRHPRIRFGKVHAFNNFYDRWQGYGIGCSHLAECYSERNIFEAAEGETDAIIIQVGSDPEKGNVISVNDWTLNGAQINERNTSSVFRPSDYYSYSPESSRDSLRDAIQNNAGWQGDRPN